jgi:putative endonuclease
MNKFYYVHILVSEIDESAHYTRVPANLKARLQDHNRGSCSCTAKGRPWEIQMSFAFRSETKAGAFEKYLKSGSGREFACRHF